VALALIVTLPFDFYWYIAQHFLIVFGVAVILAKVLFLILYAQSHALHGMSGLY
jgi:hypothetical protein